MRLSYLLFFFSLTVLAQTKPTIEVIPNPQSLEDFDHQYKGCLENSECDQVMGMQLDRWKDLISKLKEKKVPVGKEHQYLEAYRSKYGLPIEFYTTQKSQQGFKPLLFDSHCRHHNPKEGTKTLKGMAFVKSITNKFGVAWRDQTQVEVPIGELFSPQPVYAYGDQGQTELYYLPLGDQPLFIKDKSLYVLREEDGLFYMLQASANGDWKVVNFDMTELSSWEERRSTVTCPKDAKKLAPDAFGDEFCRSVWNVDLKKPTVVKMHQGCII